MKSIMSETLRIRGKSGDYINIKIVSRCYPTETDYWDGNWLNTEIYLRSGTLKHKINANLRTDEFDSLLRELDPVCASLKGTAKFEAMEECLILEIEGHGDGTFVATGSVKSTPGARNKLGFSLDFDKGDLLRIMSELNALLRKFPIVGK